MSGVELITSHLEEYVKSYQPECLRALGILCLNKAVERRPRWGNFPTTATDLGGSIVDNDKNDDDNDVTKENVMESREKDSATASEEPEIDLCDTIQQVTRNIALLTRMDQLEGVKQEFDKTFHWLNAKITVHRRQDRFDRDQGYLVVSTEDKTSEITPSHIRGEAYEIMSALAFKCRGVIPMHLQNYYIQDSDPNGDENGEFQGNVTCTVKRVFLSEKQFKHEGLRWRDNREKPDNYFDDVASYMKTNLKTPGSEDHVKLLVEILERNVNQDLGFDLLVELEEKRNGDEAIRHFMIAQCKYRSWEEAEIDMATYVGKYYNIVNLFDQINKKNSKAILCPFFWISTQLQPDGMNYFASLEKSGRIIYYGHTAMQYDNQVCNLIPSIRNETRKWLDDAHKEILNNLALLAKPPREPRDYQNEAVDSVLKFCEEMQTNEEKKYASVIMATGSGKTLTSFHSATRAEEKLLTLKAPENGEGQTQSIMKNCSKNRKASLHLSPMIRLVMQNAHEWLSEEISIALDSDRSNEGNKKSGVQLPIYYCVCSLKERSSSDLYGCTSIRIICTKRLYGVVKHHKDAGTLHHCRFFTTYQAGRSLWMQVRKINMEIYEQRPTFPFFGVTIRDEAHSAVGRGSKSHSASLFIPTDLALSFTASAKYDFDNVKFLFPNNYDKEAESALSSYECEHNFLSLEQERLFPQINRDFLENKMDPDARILLASGGVEGSMKHWEPEDLLSQELLFEEYRNETTETAYDWAYFQERANEKGKGIVVFFVDDTKCFKIDNIQLYNLELDEHDRPKYFGAVTPALAGHSIHFSINFETECFGVNKSLTKIFEPFGEPRGFSMHDMTGLGDDNRIGPIIHTLSYAKCMEKDCLAPPRLITLKRKKIEKGKYKELNIQNPDFLDKVFGMQKEGVKAPSRMTWKLTISGQIIEASVHQFRSMKLLLDCFLDEDLKLKRVLVFCSKTEESKLCRRIFEALLTRYFQEAEREKFYLDVIYSSDANASDDDESDMSYEEQQYKLAKFSQAEKSVLFNVKLIGIGVDMPSIDAALIVRPSKSPSDITQKDGRALRKDSRNPSKKASIIVPCLCPFDTEAAEPIPSIALTRKTATRIDDFDDQETSVAPSNSTPFRGLQSREVSTPGEIPPEEDLGWSPPLNNSFEERFFLQVRVLQAMMDDKIEMITSMFDGSRSFNAYTKKIEDKPSTAKSLITSILGDSKGNHNIPVFDEKLSEFLLSLWDHVVHEDLKSKMPYRPARVQRKIPKGVNLEKLKILCIVASVAVLEIGVDETGKSKLQTDERRNLRSLIWYKACVPFAPQKKICLNHIESIAANIQWESIQFENCQAFKECLYNGNSNFFKLSELQNGAADVHKHCKDAQEWKEIVNTYLACLVENHAYEKFMQAFEATRGGTKDSHRHDKYGFTTQEDFLSALNAEIDEIVKSDSKFCHYTSGSTGKRAERNADSSITGAAGNSTVKRKRRGDLGESKGNSVSRQLVYDDNEGAMSTAVTAAASAFEHAPPENPNDDPIEVQSQPPNEPCL
eukprot:jgi/Picsp_1/3159/NSC_05999-R1_type iii restriction protein res subunit